MAAWAGAYATGRGEDVAAQVRGVVVADGEIILDEIARERALLDQLEREAAEARARLSALEAGVPPRLRASARDTRCPRAASCRATLASSSCARRPRPATPCRATSAPSPRGLRPGVDLPGPAHEGRRELPEPAGHPLDTAERGGDAAAHGVPGIHRAHVAAGALRRHDGLHRGQRVEPAESAWIMEPVPPMSTAPARSAACTAARSATFRSVTKKRLPDERAPA